VAEKERKVGSRLRIMERMNVLCTKKGQPSLQTAEGRYILIRRSRAEWLSNRRCNGLYDHSRGIHHSLLHLHPVHDQPSLSRNSQNRKRKPTYSGPKDPHYLLPPQRLPENREDAPQTRLGWKTWRCRMISMQASEKDDLGRV